MQHFRIKRRAHGGFRILRISDGATWGWMRTWAQAVAFAAQMERAAEREAAR